MIFICIFELLVNWILHDFHLYFWILVNLNFFICFCTGGIFFLNDFSCLVPVFPTLFFWFSYQFSKKSIFIISILPPVHIFWKRVFPVFYLWFGVSVSILLTILIFSNLIALLFLNLDLTSKIFQFLLKISSILIVYFCIECEVRFWIHFFINSWKSLYNIIVEYLSFSFDFNVSFITNTSLYITGLFFVVCSLSFYVFLHQSPRIWYLYRHNIFNIE